MIGHSTSNSPERVGVGLSNKVSVKHRAGSFLAINRPRSFKIKEMGGLALVGFRPSIHVNEKEIAFLIASNCYMRCNMIQM